MSDAKISAGHAIRPHSTSTDNEQPPRARTTSARDDDPASAARRAARERGGSACRLARTTAISCSSPVASSAATRRFAQRANRAGAERDHESRPARAIGSDRRARRHRAAARCEPATPVRSAGSTAASASTVTPGIGSSPAGVDVGQHDLVGLAQRRAELVQQLLRARVAVRLERHDQPPVQARRAPRRAPPRSRSDDGRSRRPPGCRQLRRAARSGARRRELRERARRSRRTARRARGRRRRRPARSAGCGGRAPSASSVPSALGRALAASMHDAAAARSVPTRHVRAREVGRRVGRGRR